MNKIRWLHLIQIYCVCFLGYLYIKPRTWVGEDAFIFFKYVDNFVNGHGLVFNIGERVEGFTAPLWVFLLSFIRLLTGFALRPTAIYLGFILTLGALGYLLYKENSRHYVFPLGLILLVTNSAFRDFSTSGFETSLTYLLLIVFAVNFKEFYVNQKLFLTGLLLSLLVLNRPESFLLFVYVGALVIWNALKKCLPIKTALRYFFPFLFTVVPYQIFRIGYYASLLPNTFYAKKGGEFYLTQGWYYLKDFIGSYPYTFVVIFVALSLVFINKKLNVFEDTRFKPRVHLVIMSAILLGYVLYSGGDYMHGRSLLMFFILLVVSVNDFIQSLVDAFISKIKGDDLEKPLAYICALGGLFIFSFVLINQKPVTVLAQKQINNINDERTHFGMTFNRENFKNYVNTEITGEFSWRDRGYYYKDISDAVGMPICVVMPNIGFFGYAGGDNVKVFGATLIDPWIARRPIEKRGKIGHENDPELVYVLSRKPTFAYTPFKIWNNNAHAKFIGSRYVGVITDDSNDSFIPVFDLSNVDFIKNYSVLTRVDILKNIDEAQIKFLNEVTVENIPSYDFDVKEYFSFLKIHWYPYTSEYNRNLYAKTRNDLFGNTEVLGSYEDFEITQRKDSDELWKHVTSPLTLKLFFENFAFALTKK